MENMYVLSRKDPFFGDVLFYVECKSDTTNISKATRFSLDEAMKRAKFLNCGTCHYSCVRIPTRERKMKKHLKLRLYGMHGETDIDIDKIIAQYGLSDRGVYNVGLVIEDEESGNELMAVTDTRDTIVTKLETHGKMFNRNLKLTESELPDLKDFDSAADIVTYAFAGDTDVETEEWIAKINTTIRNMVDMDMSRPVVVINETDAVAVDSKDLKARFASTENQANDDKSCRFNAASIAKTLIKLMPKYFVDYDNAMNTLYVSTQAAQNYALRLIDGLKISGTPYCVKIV